MRFCTFGRDGSRVGILRGDNYILDVAAIDADLTGDLLALASDADRRHRLHRVARGQPPPGTLVAARDAAYQAPVTTERVVLRGGQEADLRGVALAAAGATLPAAPWSTGVAAVVRHRTVGFDPDTWREHVLGFTLLHVAGDAVCMGPWIVGLDEVLDARKLAFSAFVDDEPRVRPAKALLDWGAELARANEERTLRGGDVLAVATAPQDVSGDLRAALVYDGRSLMRLEAHIPPAAGLAPDVAADPPPAVD
jgi:hypothetical protein